MQFRGSPARVYWALAAPFVVALAVRMLSLGERSIAHDEAWSVRCSLSPTLKELFERLNIGTGPVYPLALRGWAFVFGSSEAALRSLSVLAGALAASGAAVWTRNLLRVLRREMCEGKDSWVADAAAAVAGLVVALHPLLIGLSREVRPYAFSLAFGFWAGALSVPAYLGKGRSTRWARVLVPILAALAVSDHLFTAFLMIGVMAATWMAARSLGEGVRPLVMGGMCALAVLTLQVPLTVHQARLHYSAGAAEIALGLRDYGHFLVLLLGGWPAALAMMLVVTVLGMAGLRGPLGRYVLGVLLLSCMPFLFIHFLGTPLLKGGVRYVAWAIAPMALVLAGLAATLHHKWTSRIGTCAILFGLAVGTAAHHRHELDYAEDWRKVSSLLSPGSTGSGMILCAVGGIEHPLRYYYNGDMPVRILSGIAGSAPEGKALKEARAVRMDGGTVWLVWSHRGPIEAVPVREFEAQLGPATEVDRQWAIRVFRFGPY